MATGDSLHSEVDYDSWGVHDKASLGGVDVARDKRLAS